MNLITTYNRNRSISNILQTLSGFTRPEIDWPLSDREDSVSYTTHIKEDDQVIEIALPGYAKKNIDISLTDKILEISSKDQPDTSSLINASFKKQFRLAKDSDIDSIKASLKHGLLKIVVPINKPEVISKKITLS
jgi:HSP20 family molecular chaperone IbpA